MIRVYLSVIQGLQGKAGGKGAKGEVVSTWTYNKAYNLLMNYTSFGFVSECIDQIKRQTSYITTMVSDLLQMEGYLRYILIWLIIVLYSGKTRGDGKNWTIWRARYPCMYLMQNKHIKHHKCRKTKTYSTKSVKFNVGLCDDTIIGAKVVIAALPKLLL